MANEMTQSNNNFPAGFTLRINPNPTKAVGINYQISGNQLLVKFEVNGGVTNYRKDSQRSSAERDRFNEVVGVMKECKGHFQNDNFWCFDLTTETEHSETYIDDTGLWEEEVTRVTKVKKPTLSYIKDTLESRGYHVNLRTI